MSIRLQIWILKSYYAYLENKLEVFKANSAGVVPFQKLLDKYSGVNYKIISELTLKPKGYQIW